MQDTDLYNIPNCPYFKYCQDVGIKCSGCHHARITSYFVPSKWQPAKIEFEEA